MTFGQIFTWLSQKLYPTGRAFRMPEPIEEDGYYITEDGADLYVSEDETDIYVAEGMVSSGGILFRLHRALSVSFGIAYAAAVGIFNHIF